MRESAPILIELLSAFAGGTDITTDEGEAAFALGDIAKVCNHLLCDGQANGVKDYLSIASNSPVTKQIANWEIVCNGGFDQWDLTVYFSTTAAAVADGVTIACPDLGMVEAFALPNTGGSVARLDKTIAMQGADNQRVTVRLSVKAPPGGTVEVFAVQLSARDLSEPAAGKGVVTDWLELDDPVTPDLLYDCYDALESVSSRQRTECTVFEKGGTGERVSLLTLALPEDSAAIWADMFALGNPLLNASLTVNGSTDKDNVPYVVTANAPLDLNGKVSVDIDGSVPYYSPVTAIAPGKLAFWFSLCRL